MNLLMLLSALLSALTGVGAAVRRPEVAQIVAQTAAAGDVARIALPAATRRPMVSIPTLPGVARQRIRVGFALLPAIAPWTSRRRE